MKMTEYDFINRETEETGKALIEENCCLELDDKKFCSGGAVIYPDVMVAYTSKDKETGELIITTWKGDPISNRAFYGGQHPWGYTYTHFIYDGSWWLGRESSWGSGSIMKAKRTKELIAIGGKQ